MIKEIYICINIFKCISSFLLLKSLKISAQNIQPLRKSPNHIDIKIICFLKQFNGFSAWAKVCIYVILTIQ